VLGLVLGLTRGRAHQVGDINLSVDLGYSKYNGSNVSDDISQWLGIRYAAAPNGTLRFRAPEDPPVDLRTYAANTVS
jgi:hypothetical protein